MDAPAKRKRKQWSTESMKRAIISVRAKEMGLKRASNHFNVPKSTLKDKVNSQEQDVDKLVNTKLGRKPTLGAELEKALVSYCLEMEARFYGLRTRDVKNMAFLLAERNGFPHPFAKKDQAAGWKWLHLFMKRHPQLSFRRPQATSMGRIRGFSREKVNAFFDIFEPLMEIIKHSPNKLYNCDETGLTVVQHKTTKVLSLKGKRQVGSVSSAERGSLVTVVTCMSAAGHYVPPLLVFPRVNMKIELLDGTPNGTIAVCHKSGWIQMDSFLEWFQKQFLPNVKPSKDDPVVLVLDGHYSHTRNLELLEVARENGVHLISLPPHCTHKMQPLDRAFMFPLKAYYSQAIETWLRQNSGRTITHYQVGRLFGEAYNLAATVATAANGFRNSGLFPCNRNIFQQHEFISDLDDPDRAPQDRENFVAQIQNKRNEPQPCCSKSNNNSKSSLVPPDLISPLPKSALITPAHISPLPSTSKKGPTTTRGRKACAAALLTSSPYKDKLAEEINKSGKTSKEGADQKKSLRLKKVTRIIANEDDAVQQEKKIGNIVSQKLTIKKKPQKKRRKHSESSSDSSENVPQDLTISTDEEDSDNDVECPYCNETYLSDRSGEKWIVCIKCRIWCHEQCSGTDNYKTFICDFCLEG